MDTKKDVRVFDNADQLNEAACNFIIDLSKKAIEQRGLFTLVLSGGSTPERLYSLLAQAPFNDKLEWNKTFIFWGDERCVPLDDKLNNAAMANSLLLSKVNIPAKNIHPIPVNLTPVEAALSYEETIKNFFNQSPPLFDLILLGLGENGHTASLFPYTAVLHEISRLVKEVYVEEQQMFRVTMTAPLINKGRNIAFLVTGKQKHQILKTVLTDSIDKDKYPVELIRPEQGELIWWTDKDAYIG
ncbi:MAG: 6-phosphogluconolactonase [Bacteroidota bacterium]|nr:6-phosphogluconolactonase [Bacteroidota bacterium]